MKIEVIEERDEQVTNLLIDGVREFNTEHLGPSNARPLSVIARDDAGEVIAGVSGRTIYGHYLIEVVWVSESRRGDGLGKQLMLEAERRARERGCVGAQVDTLSMQAPGFYEKLGFEIFGTVEDFPRGHDRHFLKKDYL